MHSAGKQFANWLGLTRPEVSISTDRLLLREFRDTEGPALLEFYGDPVALEYELHAAPFLEEDVADLLWRARAAQRVRPRVSYPLAIVLKADERLIGECTLTFGAVGDVGLGFILNRAYWRQGYATEAARAAIDYAFNRLGRSRIVAGCHPDNHASRRVLEKLGLRFVCEGNWNPAHPKGSGSLIFVLDRP